jgi:hypothetical protein
MASRDFAIHFARIAALDSGIGIILSTLVKPIARSTVQSELYNRIRRDESRHVGLSRQHSCRLGGSRSLLEIIATRVRPELVTLLYPLANSLEDLGVDSDCLFAESQGKNRCMIANVIDGDRKQSLSQTNGTSESASIAAISAALRVGCPSVAQHESAGRIAAERCALESLKVSAGIQHRAGDHIAAEAGKGIKVCGLHLRQTLQHEEA